MHADRRKIVFLAACLQIHLFCLGDSVIYVNNLMGNDRNNGSREQPLASLYQACQVVEKSGRIEVSNTGKPYRMPYKSGEVSKSYGYRLHRGGTWEKPLLVEGHGAVLSGLAEVPAAEWKSEGNRIYSLYFYPMSNLYKNNPDNYWLDRPRIWFVDGKPAPNLKRLEELQKTPGGFWWNKKAKRVFFHLPQNRQLSKVKIELPANYGFYMHADHIQVKNFVFMFSVNDGFDADGNAQHGCYVNCLAYNNCGQGMSLHRFSNVSYINCGAINCASSNVCNVNSSIGSYYHCVFLDQAYEANVFITDTSSASFYRCLIAGCRPGELIRQGRHSKLTFNHCVLYGNDAMPLLKCQYGATSFSNCNLMNARYLFDLTPAYEAAGISVHCCIIAEMKNAIAKLSADTAYPRVDIDENTYDGGGYVQSNKLETIGRSQWLGQRRIDQHSEYRELKFDGILNTELRAELSVSGKKRGTVLTSDIKNIYERLTRFYPLPDGLHSLKINELPYY